MRRGVLLMLALVLALPAAASASGEDVIRDCSVNARLTRTYSRAELLDASHHLPADLAEYSNCPGVISAALRAASVRPPTQKTPARPDRKLGSPAGVAPTGGGGHGGGGGGGAPSPQSSSSPPSSSSPSSSSPSSSFPSSTPTGSAVPDANAVPHVSKGPSRRHPTLLRSPHANASTPAPPAHASRASSGLEALPTPLLVLLVALLLAAVAGSGLSMRRRLGGNRRWSDVLRRGA